jgi:radical SAM superfamily enzyme YgiQ (UPF0313 family)
MNILMIYPQIPDTFWSFKHALRFIRRKASNPPLGLLTVAAMLPVEWNKRVVDLNVHPLKDADIEWADYAFVSAMSIQQDSAHEVIRRCKRHGLKVVAGGPLFTEQHDHFEEVDHFVLNEAELTLQPFLEDLEQGKAQHIYATEEHADLSQTPAPMWELIDVYNYDSLSIQFTRGCPFNCDFCNVTALLGHRVRYKSTDQIIAELDKIYALGWRQSVFFVDDNFIGNRKYLKNELLPALIEWRQDKTGCTFITEVSINLSDDEELMEMMADAGFHSVFVGIETPDEAGLEACHKSQNRNRNLVESVKRLQRRGLQVMGGFIVGFDTDTPSIFQRQAEFIQQSGIVTAMVGLLQAPYNTRLYNRLKEEGRLVDEMSGDNADGSTNIIPVMDIEVLKDGYQHLLERIYSPAPYYERVRTFLKEYRMPRIKNPLQKHHILAFLRSIYWLGLRGKERMQYWGLLGWTLLNSPSKFALAVTLSIYGYHFRTVSRL